jgi:multidrug efflux pump subunit AcrA (membrane-fusion protein)
VLLLEIRSVAAISSCARLVWLAALTMGLLSTGAGCTPSKVAPSSERDTPASPLATVHPVKQTWRSAIEQPGQIEAFEETPIYANISGFVSEVCVDMNTRVKKGDCLARMGVPEMDEDLKQKTALIGQAKAELELARKALTAEEAGMGTARALVDVAQSHHKRALADLERWDSEYKRIVKLVKKGVIDEQSGEEARNQFKSAEAASEESKAKIDVTRASLAESEARRDKARSEVQATEARLQVARINEARMTAMLKYAALTAPFDGVVTQRNVHPGHLLKPASNGKSEPLFVVVGTDRVRIFVDVPETEAAYVRAGTPARVRIHALKEREIAATVTRISWALNPKNRSLRAEIELPNPDETLRPGMYAFAMLLVDHPVWAVPASSVQRRDDGCFCYVLNNGKSSLIPVRIGVRQGSMVEVLKKNRPLAATPGESQWLDLNGDEAIVQDPSLVPAVESAG